MLQSIHVQANVVTTIMIMPIRRRALLQSIHVQANVVTEVPALTVTDSRVLQSIHVQANVVTGRRSVGSGKGGSRFNQSTFKRTW